MFYLNKSKMTFRTTFGTLNILAEQVKIHLLYYFLKVIYIEKIFICKIFLRHSWSAAPPTWHTFQTCFQTCWGSSEFVIACGLFDKTKRRSAFAKSII